MANLRFGLTDSFSCSYLPEKQERLLMCMEPEAQQYYPQLIQLGFRRSGEQIYRPHCPACNACQSIRIPVNQFTPSKSQKRVLKRNQNINLETSSHNKTQYYPLYERYINQRHADGDMYPATQVQYRDFLLQPHTDTLFVEFKYQQQLLGVAVTDQLPDGLSALYTFFEPEQIVNSLGTYAILSQIALARSLQKPYLYLGYQIDACSKMSYKANFYPHQRFDGENWRQVTKKHS